MRTGNLLEYFHTDLKLVFLSMALAIATVKHPHVCLSSQSSAESQGTAHAVPKPLQRELWSTAVCFKPLVLP